MSIPPISQNGQRTRAAASISEKYPSYRPEMQDTDVVGYSTQGSDYRYPVTAKEVRKEIERLEMLAQKLEKEEQEKAERDARFQEWFLQQGGLSNWGGDYLFRP
ncbi:MAG: hypothetical protein IJ877_06495 [Candidatus Gastranaerophilales bacterium]|nr:hypothetical protein [Candidatus Gastranaerophilales bacterium]